MESAASSITPARTQSNRRPPRLAATREFDYDLATSRPPIDSTGEGNRSDYDEDLMDERMLGFDFPVAMGSAAALLGHTSSDRRRPTAEHVSPSMEHRSGGSGSCGSSSDATPRTVAAIAPAEAQLMRRLRHALACAPVRTCPAPRQAELRRTIQECDAAAEAWLLDQLLQRRLSHSASPRT